MKKKYIALILVAAAAAAIILLVISFSAPDPEQAALDLGIDMSLETELEQADRVWNHFYDPKETEKVFDDPQNAGKMFIPEGARCTQVYLSGACLFIDYQFNGVRYIVQYNEDGSVGKSARVIGGDDTFSVDSPDNIIRYYDAAKMGISWSQIKSN